MDSATWSSLKRMHDFMVHQRPRKADQKKPISPFSPNKREIKKKAFLTDFQIFS